MSGGWERLANIELSGNATVMDTANDSSFAGNDFLARDNLFIEIQTVPNTSNSVDLTFNVGGSTTAGVYNYKYQNNEAAQASSTNQANVALYNTAAQWSRNCGTFHNLAGQEKLGVFDGVFYDAGSDVPDIRQTWVKWATTAGQIQRVIITGDNTGTGFASGSSLTVWGSDTAADASKTAITNVPTGTRYEETDTRKIFRRNDTKASWTERGVVEPSRGVFCGGEQSSSDVNTMDYVTIGTLGNATDFGDMVLAREGASGCSSLSRGVIVGGNVGGSTDRDEMDYITTWSAGNATDFGDATFAARYSAGCASTVGRGLIAGGYTTSGAAKHNVIQYITIASTGDAVDFGDMIGNHSDLGACDNGTRGIFGGGQD